MKVRSCAKTYEPLSRCYRDPELDRPSRLSAECRERVMDTRDSANRKLTRWLDEAFPRSGAGTAIGGCCRAHA